MNLLWDIDEAINNGIDILKNDVELVLRELLTNDTFFVSAQDIIAAQDARTTNEVDETKDVKVFSIRTEGKRIPGKEVVIYVFIVACVLLYFY